MASLGALWLVTLAFLGARIVNAVGSATIKDDFVRWAYSRRWNVVTGGPEVLVAALVAALIALPAARVAGLTLGDAICLAAVATSVRCRDYGHVPPYLGLTALSAPYLALLVG